ncbi:hypothetical protein Pla52o_12820 [Novipirellula galeiformis]|uniref:Uncharacterized protein n=1 Tax=Novipirellula galeiformis TaxID=2528004 RepID=A0A5C6CLN2_9BACT|nr:DUF1501 domain-containing protein [Novipirellula galeiformis]TWU24985.1 hypothetical protein Pla52o_12820 [Novipirellula galeiformis]
MRDGIPNAIFGNRLEQRGLLDEMGVVEGGEFGRTPCGESHHGNGAVTGRARPLPLLR